MANADVPPAYSGSSPILQLPPELLSEIFAYTAELEPTRPTTLGWIRLGHVSCAFRSALLGMRWLWALAVCNVAPRAREEARSRASGRPLCIQLKDENEHIDAERIDFAMENITAARRLDIEEFDPNTVLWTYEPSAISGLVFPHLEKIILTAMHRPRRDSNWLGTDVYGLEPFCAPFLKVVSLNNIFVPFPPENLKTLAIHRIRHYEDVPVPNHDDILPSPELFLDLLRRCINLENLSLQDSIPNVTPLPLPIRHAEVIRLPLLERLWLTASMSKIATLWSHIELSPNSVTYLQSDYTEFAANASGFVDHKRLSFLPAFLEHVERCPQIVALAVWINDKLHTTHCGLFKRVPDYETDTWEGLTIIGQPDEKEAYTHVIDFGFCQCIWDETTSMEHFIGSIPVAFVARVDSLDVKGLAEEDLRRLLSRLPYLHTITMHHPSPSFFTILSSSGTKSTKTTLGPSDDRWMPQLRHLRVLDFSPCAERGGLGICFQELLDAVRIRSSIGLPLRSLRIETTALMDTDRTTLESIVADIKDIVPIVGVAVS